MQLVPLPTGGRVTVVPTAALKPGTLHVALRPSGDAVLVEVLGANGPRQVGRLSETDAAGYWPVLARLTARGCVGTCPARVDPTGNALTLHLGAAAACAARPGTAAQRPHPAVARTTRIAGVLPTPPCTGPRRTRTAPAAPVGPRPPVRFGRPDDPAPRLTRAQRRRVGWASVAIAAVLLLGWTAQGGAAPATVTTACTESTTHCP